MNIYLDMDDVVADWTGFANEFFGTPGRAATHYLPDEDWKRLKLQQRMYRDLKVKDGALELVGEIKRYCQVNVAEVFFLTALPHDDSFPFAPYDKVRWCERYFPGIVMFIGPYAKDKHNFCKPGDILIDDRRSNCEDWVRAGGRAYEYTTWQDCEPWLKELLK